MNKTPIPWADYTWNPITGCTKGCEYCYARGIAKRFSRLIPEDGEPIRGGEQYGRRIPGGAVYAGEGEVFPFGFRPTMYENRLAEPLKLKKPSRIFLGSMGDLFDPAFPDEFRDRVLGTVIECSEDSPFNDTPQHTFLLLTKQMEAMRRYFVGLVAERKHLFGDTGLIKNLHLGVTVTNQADADERIPLLLDTPAAHRWVSVEPMLGPVDLLATPMLDGDHLCPESLRHVMGAGIDWVVVGGKTPGKPLHSHESAPRYSKERGFFSASADALRLLRDQCEAAGVPFFYKHGSTVPELDGVKHDALPGEATDV